jgi:hypothetical protein
MLIEKISGVHADNGAQPLKNPGSGSQIFFMKFINNLVIGIKICPGFSIQEQSHGGAMYANIIFAY